MHQIEFSVSNHLHEYLLKNKVYKQNNYQDGPDAYAENTHLSVLRPFICYGRELISFRSPTVTPPETAAVADTRSTDPESGSDYRVMMLVTLAWYVSIFRASCG